LIVKWQVAAYWMHLNFPVIGQASIFNLQAALINRVANHGKKQQQSKTNQPQGPKK
jgi:hypothetical protein